MRIDAHAHLDEYPDDRLEAVLAELARQRIFTVAVATDPPSYRRTQAIARRSPWVLPAFGVHPWKASEYAGRLEDLSPLLAGCGMLGEIGLDRRFVTGAARDPDQQAVFEFFLAEAAAGDAIVNLHTSGAEAEVLRLLDRHGIRRAIVHWYHGPLEILRDLAERGFYFTVGVEVLYSPDIRAIARTIPPPLLLTETDNPGGLAWLTGQHGMPGVLLRVIGALAELLNESPGELERAVRDNFMRLVGDDPRLLTPLTGLPGGIDEDNNSTAGGETRPGLDPRNRHLEDTPA